jgi:thiol-disulfide isomerase/thioredoxin
VSPLQPGASAPAIPGVDLGSVRVLWFHKVTCPVCKLAAPVAERLQEAFPGHLVGVGQDPLEKLEAFGRELGTSFPVLPDAEPYDLSNAYGIRTVPTMFVVEGGEIADTVESWDREGYNRVSRRLSEVAGADAVDVSTVEDGLPSFRPG